MNESVKNGARMTIIDLFSGVGGFSLGATRAGFSLLGAVDNDTRALESHRINFPNSLHWQTDLSLVRGDHLAEHFGFKETGVCGIIGGPPCQGFSAIGRNDSDDPRNRLFVHFFRIVAECLPDFFLAENVPGILTEKGAGIRGEALSHVENDYVVLPHMKLSANDFGAPTTRTRVFFFGYRRGKLSDLTKSDFSPPSDAAKISVRDALKGLPKKIDPHWQEEAAGWRRVGKICNGDFGYRLHGHIPEGVGDPEAVKRLAGERRVSGCLGTVHSAALSDRYSEIAPGKSDPISKSRRLVAAGFCPTLRAGTGSDRGSYQAVRPLHPTENRVITPREAARLQGFPDWFRFHPTKWHSFRQIGNSVSPILAEYILRAIRTALIERSAND
ncbi:MAG: cytosine methyltransferase [Thermodesulfovibrio sp.]|nr:cytosine methyltransferase [Thermodesulfovibrio sp.]